MTDRASTSYDGLRCEVCGAAAFAPHVSGVVDYLSGETFDILACGGCGLGVTWPLVPDARIEPYYSPRYRGERQKYTAGLRVKRRAAGVERWFPNQFKGRLLDVGCGPGGFAMEMRRRGWDVAVTEIDRDALARLAAEGIVGKTPDAAAAEGFDQPFDAVTCWHVLEHVERPADLARWVHGQLKPDGVFVATVPNVASWQAKVSGGAWMHLDPPRHRYHFNRSNLRRLLNDAGFDVVRETTFAAEYDVFGIAQSALNRVTHKPNVLFEMLTNRNMPGGNARAAASTRDRVLSYALGPPLIAAAGPLSLASWVAGAGATLTFTCRPRSTQNG